MLRGKAADVETGAYDRIGDRGYSFCNCRNIFFTDWKNIDLRVYDDDYVKRCEGDQRDRELENEKQWEVAQRFCPNAKSILNIGDYDDRFFNLLKKSSWKNMEFTAIDIIPRESKYEFILANFDEWDTDRTFDIVWMSHCTEHVKDPVALVKKVTKMLNPGGIFFNAMPDTNHIDWNDYIDFPFLVSEHHTLWNLYDWSDFVESYGLKNVYKNLSHDVITTKRSNGGGDIIWIKESRTIFQKQQ